MTNATVSVSADETAHGHSHDVGSDEHHVTALDIDRVRVSFPAEDGGDTLCRHCGDAIVEAEAAWLAYPFSDEQSDQECEANDNGPHEPETGPGTWCNSAQIIVDDEEDSVSVSISVGDPRGGFSFAIRRLPDDAPNMAGRLILHVPYPGEGMPHETLTQLHPGTFLIGGAA